VLWRVRSRIHYLWATFLPLHHLLNRYDDDIGDDGDDWPWWWWQWWWWWWLTVGMVMVMIDDTGYELFLPHKWGLNAFQMVSFRGFSACVCICTSPLRIPTTACCIPASLFECKRCIDTSLCALLPLLNCIPTSYFDYQITN